MVFYNSEEDVYHYFTDIEDLKNNSGAGILKDGKLIDIYDNLNNFSEKKSLIYRNKENVKLVPIKDFKENNVSLHKTEGRDKIDYNNTIFPPVGYIIEDDKYKIMDGNHRFADSKRLGLEFIPVIN